MEERLRLFDFWAQAQHHWREFTPLYPSGGDVQKIIENDISRHLHHDFFPSLRFIFHILIMYVQKRNVTILTISHFYCGSQFFLHLLEAEGIRWEKHQPSASRRQNLSQSSTMKYMLCPIDWNQSKNINDDMH